MIRPVENRDIRAWAALRARLWPDADAAELEAEARAFMAGRTVPTLTAVFIAGDNEAAPDGFLELALRTFSDGCASMPVPHIEGWYVEPHARGRGIGRSLVGAAEAWALAHGFSEIASDAEIGNAASLRAHMNCGFEEVERLIKFRKQLTP